MKLKSFVLCVIIIITFVGTYGYSTVPDTCAKYAEEYCKCSIVDHQAEETSLKMCFSKEGENKFCKPCPDISQDNATCADCPELACPPCNTSSTGVTYQQTTLSIVEDEHDLVNHSRGKRQSTAHKWCRIENELLSGKFTCRAWRHKKECTLKCSAGDYLMNSKSYRFTCYRIHNFWKMVPKRCQAEENKDMSGNAGMPLNRIIAGPGHGLRVFMPFSPVEVNRGQGDYDYDERMEGRAHKRSYTDPSTLTMSTVDFEYNDDEFISATEIMPFRYLYDYQLLEPGSYWMLSNESSISYAPYNDDHEMFKVEPSNTPI